MAITISANLSKKVPLPGTDYSSHQASITVTAEITDLNQVITESQRLFSLAEAAVDQQLAIARNPNQPTPAVTTPAPQHPSQDHPRQGPTAGQSRAYPRTGARRAPAPVTESQLRFLERLVTQTGTSVDAICSAHRIGSLADLSCKEAAGIIDELKSRSVAA